MASIVISGNTSGSVTLSSPAVSGTTTLTLPTTTSTLAINGPAFSAYATSGTTISNGTFTKVTFDTEEFDINSNFASSRFTPTVAGYYQISASCNISSGSIGTNNVMVIYKNGSWYRSGSSYYWSVSGLVYCNGSTDYIEIYIFNNASGALTGTGTYNYFAGSMVRSA